jgi:hypothetical protein
MIGRHPHHRPQDRDLDSSWIDILAGLSKAGNRRMPPGFCERAGPQTERLATNPIASLSAPRSAFIRLHPLRPMAAGACRRHHLRYAKAICRARRLPCDSRCKWVSARFVQNHTLTGIGRAPQTISPEPSTNCKRKASRFPMTLLAHVAPLGWEHIDLTGDYVWSTAEPQARFRPLRDVRAAFLPSRLSVRF